MSEHFQLRSFETKYYEAQSQLLVLVAGSTTYYHILRTAFSGYFFTKFFNDRYGKYDWCAFVHDIPQDDYNKVRQLLQLLQEAVFIDTALGQTFALSYHMKPFYNAGRTEIGELHYQAKYHQDKAKALELTKHFENFILCHPSYSLSDLLIPVPFYGRKSFDLPAFLVEQLCNKLNIKSGRSLVRKVKSTKEMKNASEEEKSNIIRGAFEVVEDAAIKGKLITIIDDIYQSGNTLHELASVLQHAGATVQGLVATKTLRTSNQDN